MPRPSWFQYPDDPERGYVDGDEVETCRACSGKREVELVGLGHLPWEPGEIVPCDDCDERGHWHFETGERVEPASCSTCERVLNFPTPNPICPRCDGSARAHGRHEAERRRQEAVA